MFRCSVSNIAWSEREDALVYQKMKKYGFTGLEIAPTRVIPDGPYDQKEKAHEWSERRKKEDGLQVVSMQSIWYGNPCRLFGTEAEREALKEYTRKAIDFAEAVNCTNLVFGCPKNRNLEHLEDYELCLSFLHSIGDYAQSHGAVFAIEANPVIYGTNFINTTREAAELVRRIDSPGIGVNLDLGTMIYYEESVEEIEDCADLIHHVHISEPNLRPIQKRSLHQDLRAFLDGWYEGYVSVEMKRPDSLDELDSCMRYTADVFLKDGKAETE